MQIHVSVHIKGEEQLMKHMWYIILFLVSSFAFAAKDAPIVEFTLTPAWKKLATPRILTERSSYHWVLACTIEIKKKGTLENLFLDKLLISWKGTHKLDHLAATLYKKPIDKDFLPIEDYLICESEWSARTQRVIFKINRPMPIDTHTTLCLVFSIPDEKQRQLQEGYFEFERSSLPYLIQQSLSADPIRLSYHADEPHSKAQS